MPVQLPGSCGYRMRDLVKVAVDKMSVHEEDFWIGLKHIMRLF